MAADTAFTRRVLSIVRRVPVGRVTTYGAVARLAGKPRAARAVGNIMREARQPGVPYHRVIAANGLLGGYGGNLGLKRALLVAEGLTVSATRVRNFADVCWPVLFIATVLAASGCQRVEPIREAPAPSAPFTSTATGVPPAEQRRVRQAILDELRPVALKNCTVQRFGSKNDGGYLMCANLIDGLEGLYSYGIDTEDNWGCEVSQKFDVPVHQYDCFTPHRPRCDAVKPVFHGECIGAKTETIKGKPFDTLANQIAKNGHAGKRVLVKMDIEGAEWDSLLATPDSVLERIDQLPMELHGANDPKFLDAIKKLKTHFYLVNVHFNNYACNPDAEPLPGFAYQVLWVNKRLGVLDPGAPGRQPGSPPDAPDSPTRPDCQPSAQ